MIIITSLQKPKKRNELKQCGIVINPIKHIQHEIAPQPKVNDTSGQLTLTVSFVCFLLFFSNDKNTIISTIQKKSIVTSPLCTSCSKEVLNKTTIN